MSHETATGRHNLLLLCGLRQLLFSQSRFHVRLQRHDTTGVVVPTGMTKTPVEAQRWRRNKTGSCDLAYSRTLRRLGKPFAPGTLARKRMQSRKPSRRCGINGSGWCRGVVTPSQFIGGMIYHALMFVRYDRKVAGRARRPDVFDYRSGLKQQRSTVRATPARATGATRRTAGSIWRLASGDDPAEVLAALEVTGLTLADLNAA